MMCKYVSAILKEGRSVILKVGGGRCIKECILILAQRVRISLRYSKSLGKYNIGFFYGNDIKIAKAEKWFSASFNKTSTGRNVIWPHLGI